MTSLQTIVIPEGYELVQRKNGFTFKKIKEQETRGRKSFLKDIPEDQLTQRQKYRLKSQQKIKDYNAKYYQQKKMEKIDEIYKK